jgi:hypothetical protein
MYFTLKWEKGGVGIPPIRGFRGRSPGKKNWQSFASIFDSFLANGFSDDFYF